MIVFNYVLFIQEDHAEYLPNIIIHTSGFPVFDTLLHPREAVSHS